MKTIEALDKIRQAIEKEQEPGKLLELYFRRRSLVLAAIDDGRTIASIARALGISRQRVYQIQELGRGG